MIIKTNYSENFLQTPDSHRVTPRVPRPQFESQPDSQLTQGGNAPKKHLTAGKRNKSCNRFEASLLTALKRPLLFIKTFLLAVN